MLADRIRAFRSLIHNERATRADLLAYAVLAFGIDDREGCHPSEATLARMTRQCRKTVRASIHRLADLRTIQVDRRRAGDRVTGTLYRFPAMGESTPHHAPSMGEAAPHHGGNDTLSMGESTPPIESDLNRTGPDPDTGSIVDLEAEQVVRRVQQLSVSRWRTDSARPAVMAAITRAGLQAVRDLADTLKGAGLRPWDIVRRLEALGRPAAQATQHPAKPAPASTRPTARTPHLAMIDRAMTIMAGSDVGARMRWHARATATGVGALMHDLARWVPAIAAEFLQNEHFTAWQEVAA